MKRWILLPVLALAALVVAAAGAADPGKRHPKRADERAKTEKADKAKPERKKDDDEGSKGQTSRFTYTLVSGEDGCHGQPWEVSEVRRTYEVRNNGNGTYRLRRLDVGTFRTTGPESPGDCPWTRGKHGTHVHAGVNGRTVGRREGTVTPAAGQTFDPNATCAASCTQDAFLAAFFGPGASFSCYGNSTNCKFAFQFEATGRQALEVRHWEFSGTGNGTGLRAESRGDIADDVLAKTKR